MKETGIIMSGDHPLKCMDGTKTQTRRVIKPQPKAYLGYMMNYKETGAVQCGPDYPDTDEDFIKCPYGQVGDRLWVREAHKFTAFGFALNAYIEYKDGEKKDVTTYIKDGTIVYNQDQPNEHKWRPSPHMPRWASRITLEITEVRVERLQEITEEDAKVEGCFAQEPRIWWQGYRELDLDELGKELMHQQTIGEKPPDWMIEPHKMLDRPDIDAIFSARNRFVSLWDSLYAKRGYGWDSNPWVWVIEFKLVQGEKE